MVRYYETQGIKLDLPLRSSCLRSSAARGTTLNRYLKKGGVYKGLIFEYDKL